MIIILLLFLLSSSIINSLFFLFELFSNIENYNYSNNFLLYFNIFLFRNMILIMIFLNILENIKKLIFLTIKRNIIRLKNIKKNFKFFFLINIILHLIVSMINIFFIKKITSLSFYYLIRIISSGFILLLLLLVYLILERYKRKNILSIFKFIFQLIIIFHIRRNILDFILINLENIINIYNILTFNNNKNIIKNLNYISDSFIENYNCFDEIKIINKSNNNSNNIYIRGVIFIKKRIIFFNNSTDEMKIRMNYNIKSLEVEKVNGNNQIIKRIDFIIENNNIDNLVLVWDCESVIEIIYFFNFIDYICLLKKYHFIDLQCIFILPDNINIIFIENILKENPYFNIFFSIKIYIDNNNNNNNNREVYMNIIPITYGNIVDINLLVKNLINNYNRVDLIIIYTNRKKIYNIDEYNNKKIFFIEPY